MKARSTLSAAALVFLGAAAGIAIHEGVRPASAQPEMTQEEVDAMMAEWTAMGQPGEHHERLDPFVGEYDVKATFMMPDGSEMKSDGSFKSEWVLGGRWVHGDFQLDNMMGPYSGISFVGYDNQKEQYVSIWLDSMSTKAFVHEARFEGDVFITEGEGSMGPMKIKSHRGEDGTIRDEFYDMGPDGEWFQSGTMIYTRK